MCNACDRRQSLVAAVVPRYVHGMGVKGTILGWLGRSRRKDEEKPDVDRRPGRKSSDKEDILAADRFGMRGLDLEDSQSKPRP
jgi:hypothetical protein